MLDLPLTSVKGIGEKRAALFQTLGVSNVRELLFHLPRGYLRYDAALPVSALTDTTYAAVRVKIEKRGGFFRRGGMSVFSASARDENGAAISLKWFNQPYRGDRLIEGKTIFACGRVSMKKGVSLINPSLSDELPGILGVYPTTKGLSQRTIRDAVRAALLLVWDELTETLPPALLGKYDLCSIQFALLHAHFPFNEETLKNARKRLDFENALLYFVAVELQRGERMRRDGYAFQTEGLIEAFLEKLPFQATNAQIRVMREVASDLSKARAMSRLLQGDVGSGKTAVALFALFVAAENGRQGALLAPTEILAMQHYEQIKSLFGERAALLTGGMKKAARDETLSRIQDGTARVIVGTHALFSSGVRFFDLGLIVTDEQHRFGVRQRALLAEKGARPDVLVMSATPIPRTLALMLYGDLDLSVIDELPAGRKPIKTRMISEDKRKAMYQYLAREASENGARVYAVCPMIEDSESIEARSVDKLAAELKALLPNTRIAALHGRMSDEKKNETLRAFRDGAFDFLIATTVVEVGVHIPSARYMVVESAERFGLSQLHQLRGRVGRSDTQSFCFLLCSQNAQGETERIRVMERTNDGFEIAEQDLLLRGPGDLIGARQHGETILGGFCVGMDARLLESAKRAAKEVVDTPNDACAEVVSLAEKHYALWQAHISMN